MHRSIKGANGETFSQLLLLQLLHHRTSKAIYIHPNDNIEEKYGLLTRAYPIFSDTQIRRLLTTVVAISFGVVAINFVVFRAYVNSFTALRIR